ncbi:MAG TPA: FAD-dependent oxidoreductase [Acidocella sp.]|nr:FAD-dependent oxidoreductase [Acidocella sp.]
MAGTGSEQQRIAVIGAGISGLAAAWLLSRRHEVTLYEAEPRLGGHSHTVEAGGVPVDTGFIVYNEPAYPNLTALFEHLGVATQPSDMSFSVSLKAPALEYAGSDLAGLFAQKRNLLNPRFFAMLRDLVRFYREAPQAARAPEMSLRDFLRAGAYGSAFTEDHLYPMIAAIWSCPAGQAGDLPAAAFLRFCETHGLLKLTKRPAWRTVSGGAREYVARLKGAFAGTTKLGAGVTKLRRTDAGVVVHDQAGGRASFDHAVLACHADTALRLIATPTAREQGVLGAFRYTNNAAYLHTDPSFMPRRKPAWAAWNYAGTRGEQARICVTYWMNRLQNLSTAQNWFVTLNPPREPAGAMLHKSYQHPVFDLAALRAQRALWSLQGAARLWFCGAYFGAGFHEDGLQAGLAVAEELGGVRRPWSVADESGRIHLPRPSQAA